MKKKITIYIEEDIDRALISVLHRFHDQFDKKISKSSMIEQLVLAMIDIQDSFFEKEDEE